MTHLSEFGLCIYRNAIMIELSNRDGISPEQHDVILETLCEIIENEYAEKIRESLDRELSATQAIYYQ